MARIDRGLEIAHDPVDLADVVQQVVGAREHVAGSERLVTRLEAATVSGDRDRLVQVVANLVDNALVHGEGPVVIGLAREGGHAVLDVDDDGPGVPAADRGRVFDRMVRLDPARGRRPTAGSGLGLPIARGIAEAHGGSVDLLDGAAGARFRLRLPLT
jgi:two-component system OmpR family sensor kinase